MVVVIICIAVVILVCAGLYYNYKLIKLKLKHDSDYQYCLKSLDEIRKLVKDEDKDNSKQYCKLRYIGRICDDAFYNNSLASNYDKINEYR